MSDRETWMDLIRNEYDPAPSHYRMGDDWDDGAGRIADAILADIELARRASVAATPAGRICPPGHVLLPGSKAEAKMMHIIAERFLFPERFATASPEPAAAPPIPACDQEELRMLRERLGPRGLEVVEIDGAGHYVNKKVKAEIERLRAHPA